MEFEKIIFPASGWVPNNQRLPVLLYKNALPRGSSNDFKELFATNEWTGIWRNGVFNYQHYHCGAHEVLGIGQGNATLLIGGPDGRAIEVVKGDCLILPAGTGHMNLGCSADFEVVGAYPVGQRADIQTAAPSPEMLSRISALPVPEADPVQGSSGPLTTAWRKVDHDRPSVNYRPSDTTNS
jgi:uncharacterized protein YjlB